MVFFVSPSGVSHEKLLSNRGTGAIQNNNNQRYRSRNIINEGKPLQGNGFPAVNYQTEGAIMLHQQRPHAPDQPQGISGQTSQFTEHPPAILPYHSPRSSPFHPTQLARPNTSHATSSPSIWPNSWGYQGAPEIVLEDAEFWPEEPTQILNPETGLAQQPAAYSRLHRTPHSAHAAPSARIGFDSLGPDNTSAYPPLGSFPHHSTPPVEKAASTSDKGTASSSSPPVIVEDAPHSQAQGQKKARFDVGERSDDHPQRSEDFTATADEVTPDCDESPVDWGFELEDSKTDCNDVATGPHVADPESELLEMLSGILLDHEKRDLFCSGKGDHAQVLIDYLYSVLLKEKLPKPWLRRHSLIALYKLCKSSQLYPQCYTLKESIEISDGNEAFGGFSDIRKGTFEKQEICLKVVRLNKTNANVMLKRYAKEAILWGQLNHPNIAPFIGVYYLDGSRNRLCLVSPWMKHGNIQEYLRNKQTADRPRLVFDTVSGLDYLHELGLVHSDLKGANVLVNDAEQACITDFGMSFVYTNKTLGRPMSTTTTHGSTPGWDAPELKSGNRPSMASDIWALGCVCYEILTGKLPPDHSGGRKALKRPDSVADPKGMAIWKEVRRCWNRKPNKRPKCADILSNLRKAGIIRDNDPEEHEVGREVLRLRHAIRMDREDRMDVDEVKQILSDLRSSGNHQLSKVPLPQEKHEGSSGVFSLIRFILRLIRRV